MPKKSTKPKKKTSRKTVKKITKKLAKKAVKKIVRKAVKKQPNKKIIAKKAAMKTGKKMVRQAHHKALPRKSASVPRASALGKPIRQAQGKPIGEVTHFYTHIKVGIVKFKQPTKAGVNVRFKGATTDFVQALDSMQYDHKPIKLAPKGKLIGLKVKKRVRPGDMVYIEKK